MTECLSLHAAVIEMRFGRSRHGQGGSDVRVDGCPLGTVVAHLAPVTVPDVAWLADPSLFALALLHRAAVPWRPELPPVRDRAADELAELHERLGRSRGPSTTSMATLLAALAALTGSVSAEATGEAGSGYAFALTSCAPVLLEPSPIVRAAAADLATGVPGAVVLGRVHDGLADAVTRLAVRLRGQVGVAAVRLTGSVFDEPTVAGPAGARLRQAGFAVETSAERVGAMPGSRPARG